MQVLTYTDLAGDEAERFDRFFHKKDSMIEVNPGRVLLPTLFKTIGDDIVQLPVYESDVWMCSFPRTGSTWAQEMVWLIGNDLDYEKAQQLQQIRCPLIELTAILQDQHTKWHDDSIKGTSVEHVKNLPHPRYVRSHLPWSLLPSDLLDDNGRLRAKVIYTARNPKDLCVSFYHYCVLVHDMSGTFEEFCELFLDGRAPIGPLWTHVLGFWDKRNDPNMLFLTYEEMKRDLNAVIRKTAKFMNKTLSDEQVDELKDHLSFKKMKSNKAVNLEPIIEITKGKEFLDNTNLRFIRKGEVGDWKNHMSDKMAERFDRWVLEHYGDSELKFD